MGHAASTALTLSPQSEGGDREDKLPCSFSFQLERYEEASTPFSIFSLWSCRCRTTETSLGRPQPFPCHRDLKESSTVLGCFVFVVVVVAAAVCYSCWVFCCCCCCLLQFFGVLLLLLFVTVVGCFVVVAAVCYSCWVFCCCCCLLQLLGVLLLLLLFVTVVRCFVVVAAVCYSCWLFCCFCCLFLFLFLFLLLLSCFAAARLVRLFVCCLHFPNLKTTNMRAKTNAYITYPLCSQSGLTSVAFAWRQRSANSMWNIRGLGKRKG